MNYVERDRGDSPGHSPGEAIGECQSALKIGDCGDRMLPGVEWFLDD